MRSFARALLRLIAALAVVVMASTVILANPLTRPTLVGQAAIDAGAPSELLRLGTDLVIRQATSGGEDEERQPIALSEEERQPIALSEEERLRSLFVDVFSVEWAEATISNVTNGMETWISGQEQPSVQIELVEPKERIRNHPDSLLLVSALADPDEANQIDPDTADPRLVESAIDEFLTEIPDQVILDETSWWGDLITRTGDLRDATQRTGMTAASIAGVAAAIGFGISPRPRLASAAGWLGWLMVWTAIPTLALAGALPAIASGIPLPDELSLVANVIGETWEPARLTGWITLGGATALWALTHVIRERHVTQLTAPEQMEEPQRELAGIR